MPDMKCEEAQRLVHLRLDGELAEADAHLLEAHLDQCEACRKASEDFASIESALHGGLNRLEVPEGLDVRVRSAVTASSLSRRSVPRVVWAFAAAAAVTLVVWAGMIGGGSGEKAFASPAIVARGGESLHVFTDDSPTSKLAHTGDSLEEDAVAWGVNETTIGLRFRGGTRLELSREAVVKIGEDSVTLIKGGLYADLTEATDDFKIATPWGTVSGPGSAFALISGSNEDDARLLVNSGEVVIQSNNSRRTAMGGESVVLSQDTQSMLVL